MTKKIGSTTLVCVDTANQALAKLALMYSAHFCTFDRILYLSDIDWGVPSCDFIRIEPITSIDWYNEFMIKGLYNYIETDYVLVIQFDGFIRNPSNWDDGFFSHDYIGAPWPQHPDYPVGNGGFSLRSRRLLQALQDPVIPSSTDDGEDAVICRHFRPYLEEKHRIKFADVDTAARFSYEEGPYPTNQPFGFHGLLNTALYYQSVDSMFFIDNLGNSTLKGKNIFFLVVWYQKCGLQNEARRLLDRIGTVQTPEDMRTRYDDVVMRVAKS